MKGMGMPSGLPLYNLQKLKLYGSLISELAVITSGLSIWSNNYEFEHLIFVIYGFKNNLKSYKSIDFGFQCWKNISVKEEGKCEV